MLVDDFDREITGLRVSLTDRCNFDCVYCHNEGLGDTRGPLEPQDSEMTTDEVVRLLEVAGEFEIERVKFTGGEPMLREDLEEIIRRTPDGMEPSLTTNGSFLPDRADALVDAGLTRVNVSQDALDQDAFAEITKTGAYDRVLDGIHAAVKAGLDPVKVNMVVFEGTAPYVPEMVEFVAEHDGIQLQLIEYMPEIAGNPEWAVDIDDVHEWLTEQSDRIEHREMHDRRRYWIDGGMVEVVDPVGNETFCENCHRLRVTPEGSIKGCLNRDLTHESGDMSKAAIRAVFREAVDQRVPYYGEYLERNEDGEWVQNDDYAEAVYVNAYEEDIPLRADGSQPT